MFTGIVQAQARVAEIVARGEVVTARFVFPQGFLSGVAIGASISIHGCCLTVTHAQGDEALFDLVPESLARTSLKTLKAGDLVNAERSLKFGDEVGGHILSGHVDTVATIVRQERFEHSRVVTFQVPSDLIKYIFEKGYIGVNGASLTITQVDRAASTFKISLIPETLAKTTFGAAHEGDLANIEIDRTTQAIVDTVERVLMNRKDA